MTAVELADLIDNWVDTLMLAEIVKSQSMRVCDTWDLRDWEVTDLPDGLRFQRKSHDGVALEAVEVFDARVQRERAREIRDQPYRRSRVGEPLERRALGFVLRAREREVDQLRAGTLHQFVAGFAVGHGRTLVSGRHTV